jgi:hypothetical protein
MIDKLTNDLTDLIIKSFNNSDNCDKIKCNIIDPLIIYIFDKFYPYLIISCAVIFLMFILLLCILTLIIRSLN